MDISNQHVERVINDYIDRYLSGNRMASAINDAMLQAGVGLRPVIDHISIRTNDVQERSLEFEAMGYSYDDRIGVLERDTYWGKVYRRPGFPPLFLEQAFDDGRGEQSLIPEWVERFSDGHLHHVAIAVENIEHAIERYAPLGVRFSGKITGEPHSEFRQIYSEAEVVDDIAFTVIELVERRWGYAGFLPPSDSSTLSKRH